MTTPDTEHLSSDVVGATPRAAGQQPMIDIKSFVPASITFIANKWSRSASRIYLQRFGIGIEAWRIMALLAIEGALTAQRVVHVIIMDKASVSRNLKSLHKAGLIQLVADPDDARQRFASLTAAGFALHDRVFEVAVARSERLLSCLDAAERQTLLLLLSRLNDNLFMLHDGDEADETLVPGV